MNIFKRAYCRVFQFFMRAAIPVLPYRRPIILQSAVEAAQALKDEKISRALIVTGKRVSGCGLLKELFSALGGLGIEYCVFDETPSNPTVAAVEAARKKYLDGGCGAIVAVGGGSPIDLAKACGARVARPKKSVVQMAGLLRVRKRLPLLIAVPTTAGTGSEVTVAAVITDDATHRKFAINDFPLIPDYAVLDYRLTLGLPRDMTAYTGMDALTHAVEAFTGNSDTRETRKEAIAAVKLICENLKVAFDEPLNSVARKNMLIAAHRAGLAFTKSYVGYVHAIAHSISGKYGTQHGMTCAVLLPVVLESYGKKAHKKLRRLAVAAGIAKADDEKAVAAKKFIDWVYNLNEYFGIPRRFDCIEAQDIPQLAALADREGNPLYPVPRLFGKRELETIYYKVI